MDNLGMHQSFQILFQDDYFIAINKPPGYLVHRSSIARNTTLIVLQLLRDQINQHIFPVHRLDRKTSGVLIFALSKEANKRLGLQFANHEMVKHYIAIVRGWTKDEELIDYDLVNDNGKSQSAVTFYKTLKKYEIDLPFGKFSTSRYSKIKLTPQTGRMHQLRKHMAHIFHPIIADRPHGCNKQNKLWKEKYGMDTMMLHAQSLTFEHPFTKEKISIEAPFFEEFTRVEKILEP